MQRLLTKLSALALPIVAASIFAIAAGCGAENVGTSVKIALGYDDALGLDTADVTLADRTESARIEHQLLLLVPDQLAGIEMAVEVWGRKAGQRAAYGTTTAVPRLGKTVTASLTLMQCSPGCLGGDLTTCTGQPVTCALGCSSDGDAHCVIPTPSNGVDPTSADPVSGTTTIAATTTFDTDTGAIIGGLDRPQGTGVAGGIGYFQAMAIAAGGAPLGIFVFHDLMIGAAATVRFTGRRAAVVLVGGSAKIAGVIDVTAGHVMRAAPGPGGGAGGDGAGPAQGCGGGAPGGAASKIDGGGGGGGAGMAGGDGGAVTAALVGAGGAQCLPMLLEPLQGGSGGGRGGPGGAATPAVGGGGGGALQITALGSLEISGTINAAGAGGDGGSAAAMDGGGGGGGGGGGAILLEAPEVIVEPSAIVAANGGGGGGGGGPQLGMAGDSGRTSTDVAQGGGGVEIASTGGSGGSFSSVPDFGGNGTTNGGGGGGGAGAIVIRGHMRTLGGTISPRAIESELKPPK
jgi:hypothetical protein